jgi:hypothetical protein
MKWECDSTSIMAPTLSKALNGICEPADNTCYEDSAPSVHSTQFPVHKTMVRSRTAAGWCQIVICSQWEDHTKARLSEAKTGDAWRGPTLSIIFKEIFFSVFDCGLYKYFFMAVEYLQKRVFCAFIVLYKRSIFTKTHFFSVNLGKNSIFYTFLSIFLGNVSWISNTLHKS